MQGGAGGKDVECGEEAQKCDTWERDRQHMHADSAVEKKRKKGWMHLTSQLALGLQ